MANCPNCQEAMISGAAHCINCGAAAQPLRQAAVGTTTVLLHSPHAALQRAVPSRRIRVWPFREIELVGPLGPVFLYSCYALMVFFFAIPAVAYGNDIRTSFMTTWYQFSVQVQFPVVVSMSVILYSHLGYMAYREWQADHG